MKIEDLYSDLPHELSALSCVTDPKGKLTQQLEHFDDMTFWFDTEEQSKAFVKDNDWANTKFGDIQILSQVDNYEYDVISIDNTIGVSLNDCEHFGALEYIPRLLSAEGGYVFTYVCTKPKNYMVWRILKGMGEVPYAQFWWNQRVEFLGVFDFDENQIHEMYHSIFQELELELVETKIVKIGWSLYAVRFKLTWV